MSDSEDSTVTYTTVSSPFGGLSDIGSPRVDGPPVMPEDPYAYVVATFQALPSLDYVPDPEEPEQTLSLIYIHRLANDLPVELLVTSVTPSPGVEASAAAKAVPAGTLVLTIVIKVVKVMGIKF
ncbi:putative reverse transcriptase domain-containing protein [Tanacetum coccineum]